MFRDLELYIRLGVNLVDSHDNWKDKHQIIYYYITSIPAERMCILAVFSVFRSLGVFWSF